MTQVQLQQLQKQLWNIANTLRGTMGQKNSVITSLGLFLQVLSSQNACHARKN